MGEMTDYYDPDYSWRGGSSKAKSQGHFQHHPFEEAKTAIRFLKQEQFWADGSYNRVPIAEMEPEYLLATMHHLLRRAASLKLTLELYYHKNGAKPELIEKLEKMSPEKFIKEMPLFKTLKATYLAEPDIPDVFETL